MEAPLDLRAFFNGILPLIGSTTLTDLEFASMVGAPGYTQANYDQLSALLLSRESVSDTQDRLVAYFKARGVDVTAGAQMGL